MPKTYQHFCPIARALEKIGDKWSLLIIRDLLRGPQRFTDLLGYLNNITPTWLTLRLRELESAGIVERDSQPGRREVRYALTSAGRALSPVMEQLYVWGLRYAMRPPLPGEVAHPDLIMMVLTASLNKRGKQLAGPANWKMKFPRVTYTLSFNNNCWSSSQGEDPNTDVTIKTTPEAWATLFTSPRSERSQLARAIQIEGAPERIEEFLQIFGIQAGENSQIIDSNNR